MYLQVILPFVYILAQNAKKLHAVQQKRFASALIYESKTKIPAN